MTNGTWGKRPRLTSMTLWLLVGLITFLAWAANFTIDQTVRAQGQIIPGSRTQIIQVADGGVLSQILVQEGQSVATGQRLATLERGNAMAAYEENRAKLAALSLALARARAEATEQAPLFGETGKEFPAFSQVQQALYEQRKRSLQEEIATLKGGLSMAHEELRMNESLYKTGDTSQLEVMRARRQVLELQGKINGVRNKYRQDASQEAVKLEEELSSSRYKLEERENILGHTILVAPVAGIVKYMKVTTIGGVLRAGDELMQISPTESDNLIEVKINPSDIGQLKLGLPVAIKFDAFDYSIYGTTQGTLSYISSDTLTEQGSNGQSNTYYRARINLDVDKMKGNPKLAKVQLKPGMTATVDIRTASRSILQYLAKPVFKTFGGALNER